MQVISKSGLKLALEITGTQEEPTIMLSPIEGKPKNISGKCRIAASQKRTGNTPMPADSLFCENAKAFIQMDLAPIRTAIAALPHKISMARKVSETVDLDGDRCLVTKWQFDTICHSPKTGEFIQTCQMEVFLDQMGITEIEISEACRIWSEANESEEQLSRKAEDSAKFAAIQKHWADMEEMENGSSLSSARDRTPAYPREG